MNSQRLKNLRRSIFRKTVIFAIVMIVLSAVIPTMDVVVSNELALTQMQNSNELYVLTSIYNKVESIVRIIFTIATGCYIATIASDIRYIVETIESEEK